MGRKNYIGLLFFLLIILITPRIIQNEYYIGILVFAAFNCLACIGLSLLMGYAGQISLGHAAFIGIGAYTTGYLTVNMGISPWISLISGIFLVIIISIVIGIPSLRLNAIISLWRR